MGDGPLYYTSPDLTFPSDPNWIVFIRHETSVTSYLFRKDVHAIYPGPSLADSSPVSIIPDAVFMGRTSAAEKSASGPYDF